MAPGSSISHWDISAFPNLLMEPSINPDLDEIDLTFHNFYDIGWFPQLAGVEPGAQALAFTHGPNPTPNGGTLRFRLPSAQRVRLALYDVSGRLDRIRAPTLVLHGDVDPLVPVENGRLLAERIAGAALVEYPGVGHIPEVEVADEFNRDLIRFLEA